MQLPVGELVETADHRVRVTLALNARTREQAARTVERLHGVAAEYFWVPTTVDDTQQHLVLDFALASAPSIPFAEAQPRFQRALAIHLPELVQLGVYLASCAKVLEQTELPAVIAPAYLRYMPAAAQGAQFGPWRLMVVPHVDVALADWARAAPAAWSWASGDVLLGKPAPHAGAYAVGAALYAAIVGDVYPELPASERFARALRRRTGRGAGVLGSTIRAALPDSFTGEADALTALVEQLLDSPAPPADWRDRLYALADALAPYRTAVRWEYEGNLEVARGILERFAATAAADAVPWDVLGRLRGRDQDRSGALDAAIRALDGDDPRAFRDLAAEIRRMAHGVELDAAQRALIARGVAAADRLGPRLGDAGRLHFAHIEARYLARVPAAAARLAQPMADAWDNIVRNTLLARFAAADSNWALVAKLAKDARVATKAMEHGGGQLGAYVVAYLDHLDGVAHVGAVDVYNDPLYMADAFTRFVSSLDAARAASSPGAADDPLVDGNIRWLARLGAMADQRNFPDARAIRTGVEAYLSAQGLASRLSAQQRREVPPLVWYDASRLLALSGAP